MPRHQAIDWGRVEWLVQCARSPNTPDAASAANLLPAYVAPLTDKVVELVTSGIPQRITFNGVTREYSAPPTEAAALRFAIADWLPEVVKQNGSDVKLLVNRAAWEAVDAYLTADPIRPTARQLILERSRGRERYLTIHQALEERGTAHTSTHLRDRVNATKQAAQLLDRLIQGRYDALGEHLRGYLGRRTTYEAAKDIRDLTGPSLRNLANFTSHEVIAIEATRLEPQLGAMLTALDAPQETYDALERLLGVIVPGIRLQPDPGVAAVELGAPTRVRDAPLKYTPLLKEQLDAALAKYDTPKRVLASHLAQPWGLSNSSAYSMLCGFPALLARAEKGALSHERTARLAQQAVDVFAAFGALDAARPHLARLFPTLPAPAVAPYA